jgi:hypothetical protein
VKLNIVYDKHGNILAAAEAAPGADVPLPAAHEHMVELDVPGELREAELVDRLARLRVDVRTRELTEREP